MDLLKSFNIISGSLDLMVCGSDCVYLSQLLQTGSELAFTAVQHTSHCTLVAQQWKDTSTTYIDSKYRC